MASELERLTGPNAAPVKMAGGFRATDGPVFSRLGYLLFCDVPAGRILKWQAGKAAVFRESGTSARGLTFDHQGRLPACERGRVTRTEKDGEITVLAGGLAAPRDLVYAIDGSIYFTDSAVCQIPRQGAAREVSHECARPLGLALAPNQQKLYVADGGSRNIRVYDIAPDGALRDGRVFAEAAAAGLKTDEEGRVWAAVGSGITVFDAGGRPVGSIALPEPPSNCAWGEAFRGLYVTARTSLYRVPARVNGTRTY